MARCMLPQRTIQDAITNNTFTTNSSTSSSSKPNTNTSLSIAKTTTSTSAPAQTTNKVVRHAKSKSKSKSKSRRKKSSPAHNLGPKRSSSPSPAVLSAQSVAERIDRHLAAARAHNGSLSHHRLGPPPPFKLMLHTRNTAVEKWVREQRELRRGL